MPARRVVTTAWRQRLVGHGDAVARPAVRLDAGSGSGRIDGTVAEPALWDLSGDPDTQELARQVAVPEERMNSRQAEYESASDRLRSDMRADMSRLSEGMARRDAESAKRDRDNTRWQIGLWLAAVVVLGFLIRWPF